MKSVLCCAFQQEIDSIYGKKKNNLPTFAFGSSKDVESGEKKKFILIFFVSCEKMRSLKTFALKKYHFDSSWKQSVVFCSLWRFRLNWQSTICLEVIQYGEWTIFSWHFPVLNHPPLRRCSPIITNALLRLKNNFAFHFLNGVRSIYPVWNILAKYMHEFAEVS